MDRDPDTNAPPPAAPSTSEESDVGARPSRGPFRAGVKRDASLRLQIGIALVDLGPSANDGRGVAGQHQRFRRDEGTAEREVRAEVLRELVLDAGARVEDAEVTLGWREVGLERGIDRLGRDVIAPAADA